MAILAFQKPDKVIMLENDSKHGRFEFRPLEPGFGVTVGNALRRILLSSLEGYAINTIKIEGVEHEFASVPGVRDDVTNIILNLKQVRFKQVVEEIENEKAVITVSNTTEFKAGDISKYLTGFEVLNPELVICHLDAKATMQIELTINKGRGYVPAEENRYSSAPFTLILDFPLIISISVKQCSAVRAIHRYRCPIILCHAHHLIKFLDAFRADEWWHP